MADLIKCLYLIVCLNVVGQQRVVLVFVVDQRVAVGNELCRVRGDRAQLIFEDLGQNVKCNE